MNGRVKIGDELVGSESASETENVTGEASSAPGSEGSSDENSGESSNDGLTGGESSDTQVVPEGVRVHLDRALGGKFISIGGGERVWVNEEGVEVSDDDTNNYYVDDAVIAERATPSVPSE